MNLHRHYGLIYILVIILALVLRSYHVTSKPHDLYVDEVAIGWNAYSILKTGKDEYGVTLPLSFRSYGDYKLPVYIYLTTISEALLGKNALAVRLPAVLLGTFTVVVFMELLRLLTRSPHYSLLGGLLLAISPWHLHFSRAGFEATASLLFVLLGMYLILLDLEGKKRTLYWGLFCLIIALYTYHTPRLLVPLKLLTVYLLFPKQMANAFLRRKSIIILPLLFLITLPFISHAFSPSGLMRFQSESFLGDEPYEIVKNVEETTQWATSQLAKNYLVHFSLDFLFFAGDGIGRHSVRELGQTYLWQLPFFLLGLIVCLKNPTRTNRLFLAWLFISPMATIFTRPTPHALRSLPEVIPLTHFVVVGILQVKEKLKAHKRLAFMALALIAYNMALYLHIYYVHYPDRSSPDWQGGYKEAIEYATTHEREYQNIAFSKSFVRGYAFLYFYGNFDPWVLQKETARELGFGKYRFVDDPFVPPKEKTLFIGEPSDKWNGKLIHIINNAGGDPAFYIWEN